MFSTDIIAKCQRPLTAQQCERAVELGVHSELGLDGVKYRAETKQHVHTGYQLWLSGANSFSEFQWGHSWTTHTSRPGSGENCLGVGQQTEKGRHVWWHVENTSHAVTSQAVSGCCQAFLMVASVRAGEPSGLLLSFGVWSHHRYQSELNGSYLWPALLGHKASPGDGFYHDVLIVVYTVTSQEGRVQHSQSPV